MMIVPYVALLLFLIPGFVFGQTIPSGVTITPDQILDLMHDIGGFLMIAGGIVAALVMIISGITYTLAGSDQAKIKSSRDMFRAGIIGALIIFGFGIIISTIRSFATNPFDFFD